jgi:hypothetical protein
MDIFVNNTKNNTLSIYPYYLILININTRYIELHHLQNRSSGSVLTAIKILFNKLTIKSLESDEEKSFVSSDVLSYLKQHKIDYYVITEQQHQSLAIIDRFIRTMRDYLKKNESADDSKITRFIKTYNNTIHNETELSPKQMQNDKQLEVNYIITKLSQQANVENKPGYKLDIGNKVRLIESKHKMKKTRYNVTPYYFSISDIQGKSTTISAIDGSVKTVTRSRIIPLKSIEVNTFKQAKIISETGASRGSIVEIISYNSKKDTYKVKFEVEGSNDYIDVISAKELRANKPLIMSQLELEYFDKQK